MPRRLLLIDDSEVALTILSAALQNAGYEVRTSTVVHDLKQLFGSWRPDVILTDVNMPGVSGVELCRILKSSYESADVPVVLFSSMPLEELEVLARECDADGFLSKDARLEEIPRAVTTLIQTTLF